MAGISSRSFQLQEIAESVNKKSYFGLGLTLITLIVLALLIFPALTHIINLNKEISQARGVNEALGRKIQVVATAKENLAKIESDLPLLDRSLPSDSEVAAYLKVLEKLAEKNELDFEGVQFSEIPLLYDKESTLVLREIDYSINLSGNFPSILSNLKDLENFIRTANIESLSLSGEDTETSSKTSVTAKTKIYYLGPRESKTVQEVNQTNLEGSSSKGVSQ